jgi:hypothetical protein
LADHGYSNIEDEQINYALSSKHADGDIDRAFEMVVLFQESVDGIVKPYDPKVLMLGAENREGVTCYLDALLYAMFSRLGSFEPMLYSRFEDEPRRRLSTLIRLWVNLLRTGKLIQTDVVGLESVFLEFRLIPNCRLNTCRRLSQPAGGKKRQISNSKIPLKHLVLSLKNLNCHF